MALARLGDPRALPACTQALAADSIGLLTLQAAAVLADPVLLPALGRLEAEWRDSDPDAHVLALRDAMLACTPSGL